MRQCSENKCSSQHSSSSELNMKQHWNDKAYLVSWIAGKGTARTQLRWCASSRSKIRLNLGVTIISQALQCWSCSDRTAGLFQCSVCYVVWNRYQEKLFELILTRTPDSDNPPLNCRGWFSWNSAPFLLTASRIWDQQHLPPHLLPFQVQAFKPSNIH